MVKDLRLFTSSQRSYDDFPKTLEELKRPSVSSDLKVKTEDT